MCPSAELLTAAEAAKRLGVSAKALRLYEERGLVTPLRTEAGWRIYGPDQIDRAAAVADLRALGFSLAEVARVLDRDAEGMERALAAHESALEGRLEQLTGAIARVRQLRREVARGATPTASELARLCGSPIGAGITFALPWPWDGEPFHLAQAGAITYIVGPLGSGKTRLAECIAGAIPGAAYLAMDRAAEGGATSLTGMEADPAHIVRVERAMAWLVDEGASATDALSVLIALLEDPRPSAFVVDMIEHGLDAATQEALIAWLRRTVSPARPVFVMTRSNAILDVTAVGAAEAIIFCPANHAPPMMVKPYPGAPGYEALASCLAAPEVRARTEGVIAWRPTAERAGRP
jgi:DNA-binding transcriptional MerR regulator